MSTESDAPQSESLGDEMPDAPIDAQDIRLFYEPQGTLRMKAGEERSYDAVKLYRVAPLSQPNGPVAILDEKGYEILTIRSLSELDAESRRVAEAELARRYLTARVQRIVSLTQESAVTYWTVETDRGQREFVVQGLQENCTWFSDDHIMLIDVDGNRFEIPSIAAMDERSQALLNEAI
jgi:hypothetical protein